jgi:hypothetical protein
VSITSVLHHSDIEESFSKYRDGLEQRKVCLSTTEDSQGSKERHLWVKYAPGKALYCGMSGQLEEEVQTAMETGFKAFATQYSPNNQANGGDLMTKWELLHSLS